MATPLETVSMASLLSTALGSDPVAVALSQALDSELQAVTAAIASGYTLCNISNQPSNVLDYIATQLRVWNYSTSYPVPTKILLIQNALYWNSRKGTPGIIKAALTAIFFDVQVIPWFRYGGIPYHFQITCTTPPLASQLAAMTIAVLQLKSVRDYFDGFVQSYSAQYTIYLGISEVTFTSGCIGPRPRGISI